MLSHNIWWREVHGPRNLIDSLCSAIVSENTILIASAHALSWRGKFRETVIEELRAQDKRLQISLIKQTKLSPEDQVIQEFDSPEHAYRTSSGTSKIQHIKTNKILECRLLWIVSEDRSNAIQWISFIKKNRTKSHNTGLFIIEAAFEDESLKKDPNIAFFSPESFINPFDTQLFVSKLISNKSFKNLSHSYLAHLYFGLAQNNAEFADFLISSYDFSEIDPLDSLSATIAQKTRDGMVEHFREFAEKLSLPIYIKQVVWEAQVRTYFPELEIKRLAIIGDNRVAIGKALETKNYNPRTEEHTEIQNYDGKITNPYEAELGTLVFMIGLKMASNHNMPIISFSPQEENIIKVCHKFRNSLAHNEPKSQADLVEFDRISNI